MRALCFGAAAALALALPAAASAQVGNPSARALGLGENYTALARGFSAPAWNPAGLGMPDNPETSVTVIPIVGMVGVGPVTTGDLADYGGELIPRDVKLAWLDAIRGDGGEKGDLGGDVTYVAFSAGHFALSASTSLRGRINLAPDVAELLLFGNAGLSGEPGDYTLAGSRFDMAGTSTIAASFAAPLALRLGSLPDQHFALGVTLKYTVGNFFISGQEEGGSITSDPVAVTIHFPVVSSPLSDSAREAGESQFFDNGRGVGMDVGAAWQGGIFSAGVVLQNLFNTFEWDTSNVEYRAGAAVWTADTSYTSFDLVPGDGPLPGDVARRIDDLFTFSPVLAAGAAARVLPYLTVTGDLRHAFGDDLHVGARTHAGLGAELTILPFLPLQAGVSAVSGGYQLAGGLGVHLGAFQINGAAATRHDDFGDQTLAALGLALSFR